MSCRTLGIPHRLMLAICLIAPAALGVVPCPARAEQAEDDRERQVMERFLAILQRAPRRGTALDRVYGYHVERGTLDALIKTYQDRVADDPKDAKAWLLLGLLESQRGRDAAAVAALRKAEEHDENDALPSYYLGQALVLVGRPDDAAEAFERALARKPSRADMLEIYQALGRVHQRAHRNDQALAVWARLEQAFPDDARVQEQIAGALAEESQLDPALRRYEALAAKARDPYRQVQFRTEAADLKVRLGRSADALRDFEALLAGLNPESWLYREVRRKIEDVYLRNDDQAGLAGYYEAWLKKTPDDVEAMARLGRTLAIQGRAAEARQWLDRAVKLAPSRKELRLALIEQLVQDRKFAEAAAQYEAMSQADPNNPDVVRDWGRLLLKDTSRPEAERKRAAASIWRRLSEAKPKDAATAAQVADLLRQAELTDEAIDLYKKAVALAPDSPQYREYLGEYYHTLKRPDDALATWRAIAEGKNRDAKNLARLAEVLAGFGYKAEAIQAVADACALDAQAFDLRLKHADLLHDAGRFDEADAQLDLAAGLADDDEQREAVLGRRISNDQSAGKLAARVEDLKKEVAGAKADDAATWRRLARYAEAAQQPAEAVAAIEKAVTLDDRSVASWTAAARLYEASGRLGEAAEVNRKLAALDRRARTEYLTSVARLEARLGRRAEALKAGRDLLAAAPGNPEHLQFFSDLCFQLGENDEGLETLRRAARTGETDPKPLLNLAEALTREFRTEEAIELYWRAFDRTNDLDGKLGIVSRLADLYLQRDQFDRLLGRLERLGREEGRQREAALCLAQAHAASGDFGTARQQLEGLLAANPRDTALLAQLSTLAENEGDLASAAKYQKQLHDVAPTDESASRLAQLYLRAGDLVEAEAVWAKFATDRQDGARVLQAIDSLMAHGKYESVLATTGRMLRKDPSNWEALYREGQALAALDRPAEAAQRFQAILDLRRNDDDESEIAKARRKGSLSGASTTARAVGTTAARSPVILQRFPARDRLNGVYQVRTMLGLQPGSVSSQINPWTPSDFGQARMAALGWQFTQARREDSQDQWLARLRQAHDKAPSEPRPLWDWYYLQAVLQEPRETFDAAKALARVEGRDPSALWLFLYALSRRAGTSGVQIIRSQNIDAVDKTPPLLPEEIDLVLASYRTLRQLKPDWIISMMVASVSTELKRAHRTEDDDALYRDLVASAVEPGSIANACSLAAERGDIDALLKLLDAFERVPGSRQSGSSMQGYVMTPQGYVATPYMAMAQAMRLRADAKGHADVLRLLDRYFVNLRSPDQVTQRARSRAASSPNSGMLQYQIYLAKNPRYIQIDYPAPDIYLDHGAILLLRNAFELFKRDDLLSDLMAHVRKPIDAKDAGPATLYAHLELSALRWWTDEKDEAVRELEEATNLVPGDADLRLTAAELRATRQEPDEALAIADSVESVDQKTTQRRELLALRLAVQTGQVERARQAAERLFGLRLDGPTQVQLAAQMHQLGMHELAEAVLARARRRAGNNPNMLVSLMSQYQRQGKTDLAVQVAHQVLRRTPTQQNSPYGNIEDPSQREAVQVLARSGKLKEMIERVEAQLERSPQSLQLYQSLAAYYRASNQRDKLKGVYEAIAKIRPDDARLRFQLATQLTQSGDAASALDHYRAAFKKDPSLFGSRFFEVQNAFQQANKADELVKMLDELDLKMLGNLSLVTNLIQNLMQHPSTTDAALALFRKAWKTFPEQRLILIARMNGDAFWNRPEAFDYVREAVIPGPSTTQIAPWAALDQISSWSTGPNGEGRVNSFASRLLDIAARQNTLETLAGEIEKALTRVPEWSAGKALLALIRIRQGKIDEGKRGLETLLAGPAEKPPFEARMIVAQELESIAALQPIAVAVYEGAIKDGDTGNYQGLGFQFNPAGRLARLYQRAGRTDEARNVILKAARSRDGNSNYDAQYAAYMRLNDLIAIGALLLEIGYPSDALKVYNEILSATDDLQTAQMFTGRPDQMAQQARSGMEQALQGLNRETLASTLQSLLKPGSEAKDGPLDLVLMVSPREVDKAAVTSLFGTALDLAAKDPEVLASAKSDLDAIVKAHPDDLAARTAAALVACAGDDPKAIAEAADRLERMAADAPLETISEGARPNARQRAEAARRLALWLVARACWKHEAARETGDRLAALALEAARRQTDTTWALAMLREWGQAALDRGDRKTAEARWSSMLDLILVNPSASKAPKRPKPTPPGAPATKVKKVSQIMFGPAPPPPPVPTGTTTTTPPDSALVTTPDRFEQAVMLARLAAENGMFDLSLRAVREALKGGPPVVPMTLSPNQARVVTRMVGVAGESAPDPSIQQVVRRLAELEALWQRRKAPPLAVYQTLREAVLPAARPREVFLYNASLTGNNDMNPGLAIRSIPPRPRSVGARLTRWAVAAGQADDLRKRLADRQAQPMAELPALVLLSLLAQAEGNPDAVAPTLDAIDRRLQKDSLQASSELACHAALPALDSKDRAASRAALTVIERATKVIEGGTAEEPIGSLLLTLARFHFGHDDTTAGRKPLDDYLALMERGSPRYAGDYSLYRRKLGYATVASELLRGGQWAGALDMLGQFADAPSYRFVEPAVGGQLAGLARQAEARPAGERYDRLKAWSLPTPARKSVRLLASFVANDAPPEVFDTGPVLTRCADGVADTATLLIAAAREAGKLDELAAELRPMADRDVENARALHILIEIARGRGASVEPLARTIAADLPKKWPAKDELASPQIGPNRTAAPAWPDILVARACLADRSLGPLGESMSESLITQARRTNSAVFRRLLESDLASARARKASGEPTELRSDPGLAFWRPGTGTSLGRGFVSDGGGTGSWVEHEGHLLRLGGSSNALLHFAYPLTGTYSFSVDVYVGEDSVPGLASGGIVAYPALPTFAGQPIRPLGQVELLGSGESLTRVSPFVRREAFNRLTVQSEPGKVRFLVNGHLFYETGQVGRANPWLALGAGSGSRALFRNLSLSGKPSIPREVPLTDGDRLDGWVSSFYNESQSTSHRLHEGQPDQKVATFFQYGQVPESERDWSARDGQILGRRIDSPTQAEPAQSRLYFHRPLGDRETISYEFFHEPGQTLVHPALGRLAFLLLPEGVRLHWMTSGDDAECFGIRPDNIADEPGHRRGKGPLPLKPGEWNALRLRLEDSKVTLELNGTAIFERPVEPMLDRHFGFYHDKNETDVRVRKVVLKGDWPESLPAALTALRDPAPSPADRRARHAVIGEAILSEQAGRVLETAGVLPVEARYEALAAWVLPGDDHPGFRLQGEFSPSGGTIRAPALEMVVAAREFGRLDQLAGRVEKAETPTDLDRRGRLALRTLIQVARGDDAGAEASLKELTALLAKLGPDAPTWTHWPGLIAASSAVERPALVGSASGLLETMAGSLPASSPGELWEIQVRHALALARGRVPLGPDSPAWAPVTPGRASTRARGYPLPLWTAVGGEIGHEPGHRLDGLYLKVPIRGDFEVRAELSAAPGRAVRIAYGGDWVGLRPGLDRVALGGIGRAPIDQPIVPPLKDVGDRFPYRLVVKDGVRAEYVGDRKVHESRLAAEPDPWLSLVADGGVSGGVRNLSIAGSPVVPDRLTLSSASDLSGWHADSYDETTAGTRPAWEKRGDEIYGHAFDPAATMSQQAFTTGGIAGSPIAESAIGIPGSFQESLLQYHRPMLEDGEIAYEFFAEPGKTMVHPALDRLAFLLGPEGVRVHRLTDAQYERTGLDPANATAEPANRRGPDRLPLKPREWNRLVLSLAGDRVTITLNGETIDERTLEPTNDRTFGLFHYADQTNVRVRNVTYRGNWPRALPSASALAGAR